MSNDIDLGFYIVRLEITGPGKKAAIVDFCDGLNIVYGASDTGKSYIIQAIDYLFGNHDTPKDIPEAQGYNYFKITIHSRKLEKDFYIGRQLGSSKFDLDDERISWHSSSPGKKSLNTFLLDLCELNNTNLLRNGRGVTIPLSFRMLSHIILIDETNIIKGISPVLSIGSYAQHTYEFSLIRHLLTGKIYENLAIHTADEKKAAKISIDLLNELKNDLEGKRTSLSLAEKDELLVQQEKLQKTLQRLLEDIASQKDIINELERRYSEKIQAKTKIVARLEENKVSRGRFALLQEYYRSDEKRIETLGQALTVISAMSDIPCPVCGAAGKHQNRVCCDLPVENIGAAVEAEVVENRKLSSDLLLLIDELDALHCNLEDQLSRITNELIKEAREIEKQKQTKLNTIQKDLAEAITTKSQVDSAISFEQQIKDFEERIQIQREVAESEDGDETAKLSASEASSVVSEVKQLIAAWKFDPDKVSFSEKDQDILVENVLRSNHGKGVKALGCTAYIIGIMEACLKNGRKHPSFVVIDSPLVTYKPPKNKKEVEESNNDELPKDIVFNLYKSLSKNILGQIIILENVDVPAEIDANKIYFSGEKDNGTRYGLFPIES